MHSWSSPHLNGDVRCGRRRAVVRLAGELDTASTHLLRQCLADLSRDGPPEVILDVAELSFVDSAGLGALAAGVRWIHQRGGRLALRSPRAGLRQKLHLTGLDTLLAVDRPVRPRRGGARRRHSARPAEMRMD